MIIEEMYEIGIHPYLHRKGLDYMWVQLFCWRIPCLYEYMESVGGRNVEMQARAVKWGGKNAVAIIRSDSWKKETIVVNVPQNISKTCSIFLKIPNTSIEMQVVGKRLNRGGGYSLEIPVIYRFYGQEELVNWLIKKIEAVKKKFECKVSKCLK